MKQVTEINRKGETGVLREDQTHVTHFKTSQGGGFKNPRERGLCVYKALLPFESDASQKKKAAAGRSQAIRLTPVDFD